MNKKVKSKKQQNDQATTLQLGIIYSGAAGIDVGSMNMMVSYPGAEGIQTVEYPTWEQKKYKDDIL